MPLKSELKKQILQDFHDFVLGGHGGYKKTLARMRVQFFWKNMETLWNNMWRLVQSTNKQSITHFPL